jgi:hypothetical protein
VFVYQVGNTRSVSVGAPRNGIFYVKVAAHTDQGYHVSAEELAIRLQHCALAGPGVNPTGIVAAAIGTAVAIRWQPPTGCEPDGYAILFGHISGSYTGRVDLGADTTSYSIANIGAGTYYVTVRAVQGGRESSGGGEVVVTVRAPAANETTWVGLAANGEGLVIYDPECGGGSEMLADMTLALRQSGTSLTGFMSLTIRSAPGCLDAVGLSDALPVNLSANGTLTSGTLTGTVGEGPDDSGSLSANYTSTRITGSLTFTDGALATFTVNRQ